MPSVVLSPVRTVEDVVSLAVELLADLLHEEAAHLHRDLLSKGQAMPVDSLDMFDILQEFRSRTGLKLPVRSIKRNTLRSVRTFAEFVINEAAA